MPNNWIESVNHNIISPLFLLIFSVAVQYLSAAGNPDKPFQTSFLFGNLLAWKLIGAMIVWALVWMLIPSKVFYGPTTTFGYTPKYQANGELYYFASMIAFGIVTYVSPQLWVSVYDNFGPILGGLNVLALALCLYLLVQAKMKETEDDPYLLNNKFPILHEFYRGMELHPTIFGVQVKQLVNCRIGLMIWQLLILIFFSASYQTRGFDSGHLVNVLLQTIYLYKFYRWETGYFDTLDITLDRAGYYICWGCLVWVPAFYTFSSYYFVYYQPNYGPFISTIILILGVLCIYLNYEVDRQKEVFRANNGKVKIWGEQAKFVQASYTAITGEKRETRLMISGWWGIARKINYTFELAAAFFWSASAGLQYGVWPYLYFIFLLCLLVHRVFRDETKCRDKYGKYWAEYCKIVPYRLIPYVF
ncbi:hypothetical protein HA402_015214 [Bradysia odoriphaga]|nr:hypothetical protein HA402_015214 [Bradysia odoriphaga]